MSAMDREEDRLVDAVNNGDISEAEFRAEMRALRDEVRMMAEEAAEEAYDRVLGGW